MLGIFAEFETVHLEVGRCDTAGSLAVHSLRFPYMHVRTVWAILGRPLKPEEVQHFTDMARRIQGIILSLSQDLSK